VKIRVLFTVFAALALTLGVATATAGNGNGNGKGKGGNSAAAHACQHGGWTNLVRSDGTSFKNQGACVSYAAHGGTLTVRSQAQTDCQAFGGTFTLGGTFSLGTAVWSCHWTNTDATDFATKSTTLQTDCLTLAPTGTLFYPNDNLASVIPGLNNSVCAP
jgi:hypothetical protein